MKASMFCYLAVFLSLATGCSSSKKEQAFEVFNEGVLLSVRSSDAQEMGRLEEARALNKASEEKFRQTLALDSAHPVARASLAHTLYLGRSFSEAIQWFNAANQVSGELAANFRELGLSKINLGAVSDGRRDLDKAFSLDTSRDIRELTILDLMDIGESASAYSTGFASEGNMEKAKEYKAFSASVFMLAFHYDSSRVTLAKKIAVLADSLGDKKTALKYSSFK